MRVRAAVFLFTVAVTVTVGSFGFHLNDENEIGVGAYNLARGHWTIQDVPEAYYETGWITVTPRFAEARGEVVMVESHAPAVAGVALTPVLSVFEGLGSAQLAFVFIASVGYAGSAALWRAPAWRTQSLQRARTEQAVIAACGVLLFGVNAALSRDTGFALWGPVWGVQLAAVVATGAGVAALHAATERASGERWVAHATVLMLLAAGVFMFWTFGLKYHAFQAAIASGVLWFGFAGPRTTKRRAVAYLLAGIAVWFHLRTGLIILAPLVLTDGYLALRSRPQLRDATRVAAILGAAFLVGVAPHVAENLFLYDSVLATSRFAPDPDLVVPPSPAEPTDAPGDTAAFADRTAAVARETSVFAEWQRFPAIQYALWVRPPLVTDGVHVELGLLAVIPLAALAPLGGWAARRNPSPAVVFAGLAVLMVIAGYGPYALRPGAPAHASRYFHLLLPPLAFLTGLALQKTLNRPDRLTVIGLGVAVPVLTAATIWLFAVLPANYYLQLLVYRNVGIAAAALVFVWAVARPWLTRRLGGNVAFVDVPVLSFAIVPSILYTVLYMLVESRSALGAQPDGKLRFMLPVTDIVATWLRSLLG